MTITLTDDQQAGYERFCDFFLDPSQHHFVIKGHGGVGKTALVTHCHQSIPKLKKLLQTINAPKDGIPQNVFLTATTNQAAEALEKETGMAVSTIHALLGLRVYMNYGQGKAGTSSLGLKQKAEIIKNAIIFIDEASYIDEELLSFIHSRTQKCKIVFIGDPSQLLGIGATTSPVFDAGLPEISLTKPIRFEAGGPIDQASAMLRTVVQTGVWGDMHIDGKDITHLSREAFEAEILKEFTRPERTHFDSRVLAWRNKTVIQYNKAIAAHVKGTPEFRKNDKAICNKYMRGRGKDKDIKTGQLVTIAYVRDSVFFANKYPGKYYEIDHYINYFMPDNPDDFQNARLSQSEFDGIPMAQAVDEFWIDLREAYASTVNKAQGSTYDKVFVDLDDIARCPYPNQLARMLYVAISRAKSQVILTGDLV